MKRPFKVSFQLLVSFPCEFCVLLVYTPFSVTLKINNILVVDHNSIQVHCLWMCVFFLLQLQIESLHKVNIVCV